MPKKILIVSGSPKNEGNTATLIEWFSEGCRSKSAQIDVVHVAAMNYVAAGCTSCRRCQKQQTYECVITDDARSVLAAMAGADVIVMATPMYFFSASAQLKRIIDRMFSLYKWDNVAGTFQTPLAGKTFVLLASAFEDVGLDALEKPFRLTAEYSGMIFESLLVANAGVSGEIRKLVGVEQAAFSLGKKVA